MKVNMFQKLYGIIRNFDSYGHPINLTYEGETTYKSFIGGLLTILTRVAILSYLISELLQVLDKKSTVEVSEFKQNAALDPNNYSIDQSKFDMAIRLNYLQFYNESIDTNKLYRYA